MKKLFSNWKNSLKDKKDEKIRRTIQELTPPESKPFRPSIEILTSYIKNVFHETSYAEYAGASMTFKVSVAGELGQEHLIFCNFNDEDATPEYLFWLSLCYVKYKSATAHCYKQAMKIIRDYPDKVLAAKLLLEI